MENFSKANEQYCCVVGHNVILEETQKDGKRCILHCMHENECARDGGCKNRFVNELLCRE